MRLPEQPHSQPIGEDDPLPYYYNSLTGFFYLKRLRLACDALGSRSYDAVLEIGYGSGIFLPELVKRTEFLVGVDIHNKANIVYEMLHREKIINTILIQSGIFSLCFKDSSFDGIVCMSVLEHLAPTQLCLALAEINRVATDDATIVLGFPVRNIAMDTFFRIVGYRPKEIHPSDHRSILNIIQQTFSRVEIFPFPSRVPLDMALYLVCKCLPS